MIVPETLLLAFLLLPQQSLNWTDTSKMTLAQKMTVLDGDWENRDQNLKRFEFLLRKFNNLCQPTHSPNHDMLVAAHNQLKDAGLGEEGLLQMSNTLHRLTTDVVALTGRKEKCAELFSMYVLIRREKGESPEETRKGLTAIWIALLKLSTDPGG